jgi:hypothetical protein
MPATIRQKPMRNFKIGRNDDFNTAKRTENPTTPHKKAHKK